MDVESYRSVHAQHVHIISVVLPQRHRRKCPASFESIFTMHRHKHLNLNKQAERCRHRYLSLISVPYIALLFTLVMVMDSAIAFSPPRPNLSASATHLTYHGASISGTLFFPRKGSKVGYKSARFAVLRTTSAEQEEFQRSLLEAKLVNDVINTNVKEERQRNEDVAEKIGQEKEELSTAVKEVKEAVQEVSQSTVNLGGAVISNSTVMKVAVQEVSQSAKNLGGVALSKVPKVFTRLLTLRATGEVRSDFLRRRKYYLSDWTDAFKKKRQVIPAVLFLYFACLAPAVSFGSISSEVLRGSMGVVEYLLGSGIAGMIYSILCGQPMAFLAPTGLTLAFISGLFRFCNLRDLPFFSVYAWVGLWTSVFMTVLGLSGSSKLIRFCTRFTDEVFNGMLSLNFIYEAFSSLRRNFVNANPMNLSMPFVALSMALGTFFSTMNVVKFDSSKFFNSKIRKTVKNFGPVSVILLFTLLNLLPWAQKFSVPTLSVPVTFELAGGRSFLVGLKDLPVNIRLLCAFPAALLTCLFFMDQNISVRLVNDPDNKLKKGAAYNLDMIALGIVTGVLSALGLPWMCGATVQSMNHVRAMAETKLNENTNEMEITEVTETRLTGFIIHALLASTVLLLTLIKKIPMPVVSGVFLFLGRKLMTGNTFMKRMEDAFAEKSRLSPKNPIHLLGRKKMNIYTGVQVLCLMGLFGFKQMPSITIFFPAMIGVLMSIRAFVLPNFFTEEDFIALKDPTPMQEWH